MDYQSVVEQAQLGSGCLNRFFTAGVFVAHPESRQMASRKGWQD